MGGHHDVRPPATSACGGSFPVELWRIEDEFATGRLLPQGFRLDAGDEFFVVDKAVGESFHSLVERRA